MTRIPALTIAVILLLGPVVLALGACEGDGELRPPRIFFGQDVCDVCHMIVSDERYAAAIVIPDHRGRHHHLVFDDIGCVFEYEAANPDQEILATYVRDVLTREWLEAESAEYVHSRNLKTPMAFGLAAVADLDAARRVHAEYGGEFLTLDEARRRFDVGILHVGATDDEHRRPTILIRAKSIPLAAGRALELELDTPQQLPPGQHEFVVLARKTEAGEPLPDLELEIKPEMPSMGHGSPGNVDPIHVEEGIYRGTVNFTMSGYWTVQLRVGRDGRQLGTVFFDFEVTR